MTKVHIKVGTSEILIEGSLEELTTILDTYWHKHPQVASSDLNADDHQSAEDEPPKRVRKTRKGSGTRTKSKPESQNTLDAEALANTIKEHKLFPEFKGKILDQPADWVNKCRLVAYAADEPITSGDVFRTLERFKIKSALSTLSRTLSNNSAEFLTRGENPVKYDMTAQAKNAFEAWLKSKDG
jgi:hypothetical protein